jgi:formylglycine-generating enzyme required for sulfatase activity
LQSEIASDPALLAAFAASAPDGVREKLEKNDYYKKLLAELVRRSGSVGRPASSTHLSFSGIDFVGFGPGTAIIKATPAMPAVVEVKVFHISSTETSTADFRRFIAANPRWAVSGSPELEKLGLVDSDYLKDIEVADGSQAIRYVSKPAAEAYCAWLSKSAPSGYRVTLPTEAQWAYAAFASGSSAASTAVLRKTGTDGPVSISDIPLDAAGMRGLLGNVWEWCADPYSVHPASGISDRASYPISEFVVRGGSWANRADLVNLDSRGPMPASTCSAYLGFRVALVPVSE